MLQLRASRLLIASLLSCVVAVGCGESVSVLAGYDSGGSPGADVTSDAESDASDVTDASDATPVDVVSDAADASDVAITDVASDASDAESDAADAESDATPVDVTDASPMDVPPTDTGPSMDVMVDVTPDVPRDVMLDVTPDMPPADVTPMDAGPTVIAGHRARGLVSAGSVMTSRSYRMVSTLGQTTLHPAPQRSTNFRLRGGIIGAASGTR